MNKEDIRKGQILLFFLHIEQKWVTGKVKYCSDSFKYIVMTYAGCPGSSFLVRPENLKPYPRVPVKRCPILRSSLLVPDIQEYEQGLE